MEPVKIRVRRNRADAASEALEARLYVNGWCLRDVLQDARAGLTRDKFALAYDAGDPVAVARVDSYGRNAMVYVKPAYRRRGIGRRLLHKLKATGYEGSGIRGSVAFFRKSLYNAQPISTILSTITGSLQCQAAP